MLEKNLGFNLTTIFETFELVDSDDKTMLTDWLAASYSLDIVAQTIVDDLHEEVVRSGSRMNEEELKTKIVGLMFYAAKVQIPKKITVFYERPLSGNLRDVPLSVVCDCMVATPVADAPRRPFFFLQEFKKKKGEKKDPEAQMLVAMLLAQHENNNEKPVYGGFLIGTSWQFATLHEKNYCVSQPFEISDKAQMTQIIYILRKLREF